MIWINFLHLYQPANSDPYHIQEAIEKCYRPLFNFWEKNPHIKTTINISVCLLMRLEELEEDNLITQLRKLVKRGQVELVGSAAYHPLLPLIGEAEARRQIKEQAEGIKKYLGVTKLNGFFLPEMAYSPKIAKLIKRLGYRWLILDPVVAREKTEHHIKYQDEASGLDIIFRDRKISNSYVPQVIHQWLKQKQDLPQIVITATDGEIYGLRHEDQKELAWVAKNQEIKTQTVTKYLDSLKQERKIRLYSGSWESTAKEVKSDQAFVLWQDKKNKIHRALWELADLAQAVIEKYEKDENYHWSRWHLVRGLASCTFWWASSRDLSQSFGPEAWSPDEIERGVNELIRAVRSLHDKTSKKQKIKAEKIQIKIKRLIWEKHWRYHF